MDEIDSKEDQILLSDTTYLVLIIGLCLNERRRMYVRRNFKLSGIKTKFVEKKKMVDGD